MTEIPRIPLVTRASSTEEQRRVGDFIYAKRNEEYGGPSAILLHLPQLAERFELLREFVLEGGLPDDLFQLATLVVARHWSVDYVWNVRVAFAQRAGIDMHVIDAIRSKRRPKFANGAQEAIYSYSTELLGPDGVSDTTHLKALTALGDHKLIVALAALVGLYSMLAFQVRAANLSKQEGTAPLPR